MFYMMTDHLSEAYKSIYQRKDLTSPPKDAEGMTGKMNPQGEPKAAQGGDHANAPESMVRGRYRAAYEEYKDDLRDHHLEKFTKWMETISEGGYDITRWEKEELIETYIKENNLWDSREIVFEAVESFDLQENRRAARAAGASKDDTKKQPDPSKDGFTGIGNMSIDAIRKMSARIEKEKTQKEGYGAPGHNPGSGEKSVARAKALMDKKGQKGAPGLNAMMAAKREHEARRGVKKEEVEVVDEGLKQARKNVGASKCWDGMKAKGTKMKNGREVPNCVKEEEGLEELYKGKHGQSEKEYQDGRSDGGKMVSGDSKHSGAAYSSRAVKNTGPNPAGGSKKPQGQGRMTSGARADLAYRKANLKKEELSNWREEILSEEGYDRMRDRKLEMYGSGYRSAGSRRSVARSGGTQPKPMPKKKDGPSALDIVKGEIEKKYGKGSIMDVKKKKKD